MVDITFKTAWGRDHFGLRAEAQAFWARLDLMPNPDDRQRRADELCVLAYCDGVLAGVSTAQLATLSGLRSRFAFYACSVDPLFRRQNLGVVMTAEARRVVEAWSAAHPEEKVMGLAAVIQSAELREYQRRPIWDEGAIHLNLVGYGPNGEQVRVAWFRHARV